MPIDTLARRLPLLLAVAAPFLVCWLFIDAYVLPAHLEPYVLHLNGTWKLQEGDGVGWAEPAYDDSGWGEIRFPGGYSSQGYRASQAWARKRFELPASLRDKPLLLTMGGMRTSRVTLFVNGHEVGRTDESFRGLKGEVDGLEAWRVDSRELLPGSNVLAVRFEWTLPGNDGVLDGRMLLGAQEQLTPYYLRASDIRQFFQNGALALFAFMLLLLGMFMSRKADPSRRALRRSTVFVVASAAFYLGARTGLLPLRQSSPLTFTILSLTVVGIVWAIIEFSQHYCLGHVTRGGKAHRAVCGVFAGAFLAVQVLGPLEGPVVLYRLFALYIFASVLYVSGLTTATLLRRQRSSDAVFAAAIFCMLGAGVVDLLTDLYVFQAPRLFSVSVINLGLCVGVLLIADFIQLSYVNETLSANLARSNAELAVALARAEDAARLKSALLAERLASVGTLATGVAHEINNPMAYVTANLTFLSKQLPELAHCAEGDEAVKEELAELGQVATESLEGARRVNQIVKELRLFARGGGDERLEAVDVRTVARRSLNLALHELEQRARIIQELEEVPRVLGSESQLGQVCLNLLLNAGQAMTKEDTDRNELILRTRRREDGWVMLEVADTGCGIPPEDQRRLFDPFFTTKQTGEGMGMGLSICHGIVKRLGGEIQVESAVGKGSVFRVVLPPHAA
ncbi:beta-galactosidase-like protein [Archangium gephyra]|uniref:histidine kinase n=1 Tax=Archangium gephyra TaxID=48 RepID=A0AAC8TAM1_9BACT|nr:ATP-binding protein [Archangium gephyra]AKI98886.1 Sensory box histidine kinase/response regulator [Archangium gephyra]REG30803.1 beta-galactosidase-like protein [Archangium gephyra]